MTNRKSTILITVTLLLLASVLPGVGNSIAGSSNIASVLAQPPASDIGKKTVCAYCGMHLKVKKDTPGATYNNKNYYFCDEMERDAFLKNPEKYISTTPASRASSAAQATQ